MIITKVNTYAVRPRWGFVEIITDEGVSGWGEAVLEGHCSTVLACVKEMESYLIGRDPSRIEDIWNTLYRAGFYRGGGVLMSAIAGIDQCLWDIKGKFFNVPSYELMGGRCREKISVYSWIGGDRPNDVGKAALEKKQAGCSAIKMNATEELQMIDSYEKIDAVLERVNAIRESCGKYFGIAIDFHGRVHKPMAKVLAKKLEQFDPMFLEEPVLCEQMEVFSEIAAACNIPIATGERLFSRYDFKRLLQAGGVDIIQPDLSHAGNGFAAHHFRKGPGISPFPFGVAGGGPRGVLFRHAQRAHRRGADEQKQYGQDAAAYVQNDHFEPSRSFGSFCCLLKLRYASRIASAPLGITIMLVEPIRDGTNTKSSDMTPSTISAMTRSER